MSNLHDKYFPLAVCFMMHYFHCFQQSNLILVSGLSSLGAYACLREQSDKALGWLAAGTIMLSVLPFTLIFIRPINHELVKTEKCISVKGKLTAFSVILTFLHANALRNND